MFNPNTTLIDAFVTHVGARFDEAFPAAEPGFGAVLEQATRAALEALLNCDCPYHDVQHTMLVTDVGQSILRGKQLATGEVSDREWLHVVVALLFHDIGYVRGLLASDEQDNYLIDYEGNRITPPLGATDAYMTPYHVTRGCLFVKERFATEPLVDVNTLTHYIEMTRFPVPDTAFYQKVDDYAGLVRAADLLGQMADPLYMQKLSRLFAEFLEIGEADRLGFANSGELRVGFPDFFYARVRPYITEGLLYLQKTQDGKQWIANLHRHLHIESPAERSGEAEPVPLLVRGDRAG